MDKASRLFVLAALLFAGGCGTSGRPTASDAEQNALSYYKDCLDRAAHKLDDHSSDVHTTAVAVSDACLWNAHGFEESFYQGMKAEDREELLQKLSISDSRIRAATEAVERERDGQ